MTAAEESDLPMAAWHVTVGFRPEPTVRGIFGDPKARVIGLNRRSKKPFVVVAVAVRRAGTIIRFAGCAICRAATRGFSWNWRCAGSTVATAAG